MKIPTRTVRLPTRTMTIRLTDAEIHLIKQAAGKKPISTYIRDSAVRFAHEVLDGVVRGPVKPVFDDFRETEDVSRHVVRFLCHLAQKVPPSKALRVENGRLYVNSTHLRSEWLDDKEHAPTRTMIGRILRKFVVSDDLPERRLVIDDSKKRVDFYNLDVVKIVRVAEEIEPGLGRDLEVLVAPSLPEEIGLN